MAELNYNYCYHYSTTACTTVTTKTMMTTCLN